MPPFGEFCPGAEPMVYVKVVAPVTVITAPWTLKAATVDWLMLIDWPVIKPCADDVVQVAVVPDAVRLVTTAEQIVG